jgi:hypothetical protein
LVVVTFTPVALPKFKAFRVEVNALIVVPLAVVNPSQLEVAPTNVPFVAWRFVTKRFVLVVLVPVAFVQVRPVVLSVVKVPFVPVKFVMLPFEAKKFVEVTFVAVTEANTPFQRREALPKDKVASSVGRRFVTIPVVTPKKEVVAAVAVTLFKVEVPETVRSLEMAKFPVEVPPANWIQLN